MFCYKSLKFISFLQFYFFKWYWHVHVVMPSLQACLMNKADICIFNTMPCQPHVAPNWCKITQMGRKDSLIRSLLSSLFNAPIILAGITFFLRGEGLSEFNVSGISWVLMVSLNSNHGYPIIIYIPLKLKGWVNHPREAVVTHNEHNTVLSPVYLILHKHVSLLNLSCYRTHSAQFHINLKLNISVVRL